MTTIRVDVFNSERLAGWVDGPGPLKELTLFINDEWHVSLRPTLYRRDLEQAGLGDGRRGFVFILHGILTTGDNQVVLRQGDTILFDRQITTFEIGNPKAHDLSRTRWRGDEPDRGLTWGAIMTGDSLWDIYQLAHTFVSDAHIVEIGPGYGRLLKTALEREIPFKDYTGVELSAARVSRLAEHFPNSRCRFVCGDVEFWRSDKPLDVIISSSTFEHLYPDCRAALLNIRSQMRSPGAMAMIDFIGKDISHAAVTRDLTYVRSYGRNEVSTIFTECGYCVTDIQECRIGETQWGPVDRFVVIARAAAS